VTEPDLRNPGRTQYDKTYQTLYFTKAGEEVVSGAGQWCDRDCAAKDALILPFLGDLELTVKPGEDEVSVLTPSRVVPPPPKEEATVIAPVVILAGEFTAGPNPVLKQSGIIKFYRQGKQVASSELRIYDATGNVINKIKIIDNAIGTQAKRQVGSWDLKDRKGRIVSDGTYIVKGTLRTRSGEKENISVILGVR
jgi:hypothetical protein